MRYELYEEFDVIRNENIWTTPIIDFKAKNQGQIVKRYYNLSSQINVSSLSSGVYFVEIKTDSNMYINKVVVK